MCFLKHFDCNFGLTVITSKSGSLWHFNFQNKKRIWIHKLVTKSPNERESICFQLEIECWNASKFCLKIVHKDMSELSHKNSVTND